MGAIDQLPAEMDRLGVHRALILCTPEQRSLAESVSEKLDKKSVGIFHRATMHVPIETVRDAREIALKLSADCAIALGGGSTTGLGKAIALDSSLPIIAIPTTYAGSEMTPIYGITESGIKKTGRDSRVLPRTVIYDPTLTLSLPVGLSVVSGINAIAHAAEGLYASDCNPIFRLMAIDGIRALAQAIPAITRDANSLPARSDALYGAWLCGAVLGNVSMALHHKLCHTLGGSFNLPHAQTHTVVLPHALAYNAMAAPDAMKDIASAISTVGSAPSQIFDLAKNSGAPVSLDSLGMARSDLDRACEIACQNQYPNPRPIERIALRQLLQNAFDGVRP
jgi:maleylacetate reductase